MAELLAKGLLRGVIFATDDCDATFERIRAAGGEVLQEPIDQPYGVRDCAFRDPSGNMLRFSQPRAAVSQGPIGPGSTLIPTTNINTGRVGEAPGASGGPPDKHEVAASLGASGQPWRVRAEHDRRQRGEGVRQPVAAPGDLSRAAGRRARSGRTRSR